ncbi:MAG: ComF family protein [Candidatus Omnitrophica bacterium]|nr:ComF family protein [Candidatus Omnitrophota bacterium]
MFKYKNHDYLKELLASIMVSRLEKIGFEIKDYSMVTAVPTHLDKLKERGYNQASLLGKKLANHFKIPFTDDIIYGRKSRPAQVKLKKAQRQTGIKEAFQVKKQIKGENIIIVDDIVTTGSTITECALTLKKAGAKRITAITLAKTIL